MKCPSDCSGGYMVPKLMCSICIEEYSGYNGGYGRYLIISCNACFYKFFLLLGVHNLENINSHFVIIIVKLLEVLIILEM